jgi:pyruvate-formate lyase-activating enzyme
MKDLRLYIRPEDYSIWAGGDWPTYEDFMNGSRPQHPIAQKLVKEMLSYHVEEQGIKFPIRTKTSCQSKWTWSTIYLNSLSTSSCHRVQPVPFTLDEFDNFHNIPKKIQDRKLMLEGKWPTGGCEYCKNIEDAGGWSDRLHNLDIPGLTPTEVIDNRTAVHVTPKIVEIFAQNTCNFACIYCNSSLSSKIQQENNKFGEFNRNGVVIPIRNPPAATKEYFKKFLNWLERNVTGLVRLHLLGGETFIQHELMNSVLDIIDANPSPNLELCVFSNLCVPEKYWNLYISRLEKLQSKGKIKVFDLTASIDAWGPEEEYVRYGLDLNQFEQRFAWASEQGPWLRLNTNQTVTALTMKTMPELIDKIAQYSKKKHIGHYFQFYTGSQMFQHPETFAYSMWEETFNRIFKAMPGDTDHQKEALPRMQGLQKQLQQKKTHNFIEIYKLHTYLDEIDRRRGTNWRALFPYLDIHE